VISRLHAALRKSPISGALLSKPWFEPDRIKTFIGIISLPVAAVGWLASDYVTIGGGSIEKARVVRSHGAFPNVLKGLAPWPLGALWSGVWGGKCVLSQAGVDTVIKYNRELEI
jgi:hypothetical protein